MDTDTEIGHAPRGMGQKRPTKDPLAPEIGRRINEARLAAGYETIEGFAIATGTNLRLMRRYLKGEMMPGVRALMRVAETCEVSLDWLVLGHEDMPSVFLEWLASPIGKTAPEPARRYLRSLPIRGYKPSLAFYDMALLSWQRGLSAEQAVTAARTTTRALRDGREQDGEPLSDESYSDLSENDTDD